MENNAAYDRLRRQMAMALEEAAAQRPDSPESGFDEIDGALPRGQDDRWNKLHIALQFWDGWIDASNREWQYYEPIQRADWPVLAKEIAVTIREDREIVNPLILDRVVLHK